jgi:toxin ParE1/3/4
VYALIRQQIAQLGGHPGMGRPGRVDGTREMVIVRTRYIVAYTIDPHIEAVIILRVIHGARRWPDHL